MDNKLIGKMKKCSLIMRCFLSVVSLLCAISCQEESKVTEDYENIVREIGFVDSWNGGKMPTRADTIDTDFDTNIDIGIRWRIAKPSTGCKDKLGLCDPKVFGPGAGS